MKKYSLTLAVILLSGSFIFAQKEPLKIGYVNSQVILNQLPEAIKAQGDLDALTNKWTAELDTMTARYQRHLASYQNNVSKMSKQKKVAAEKRLVNEQQKVLNFRKEKFTQGTGEIYQKQNEIFGPVKKRIYKAIKKVAKEEKMQFVFDKSGNIILLYADNRYDITYKVLDELQTGN